MINKNLSAKEYINIISKIERDSYHIEKIQEFLVNFAKEHSLNYVIDEFKNIIIYKATLNSDSSVALVSHMDYLKIESKNSMNSFQNNIFSFLFKDKYFSCGKANFGATSLAGMSLILEILDSDIPLNVEAIFTFQKDALQSVKNLEVKNISSKQMICFDGFCDATLSSSSLNFAQYNIKFSTEKEFIFNSPNLKTFHIAIFDLKNGLIGANPKALNSSKLMTELLFKIGEVKINNFTTKTLLSVVPNRTDCVFTTNLDDISLKKIIRHFLIQNRKLNKNLQIKCTRQINQTLVLQGFQNMLNFIKELEQGVIADDERGIVFQNICEVDTEKGTFKVQILFSDYKLFKTQSKYLDDLCDKYDLSSSLVDSKPEFRCFDNSQLMRELEDSYVGILPLKKDVLKNFSQAGILQDKIKNLDSAIISVCVENPYSQDEKILYSSLINTSLWLKNFFLKKSQNK